MHCLTAFVNRWLKTLNISLASEHKQRLLARTLCDENVQAEMSPFTSSLDGDGQQIREVPFVYVPNIIRKIADIIEHHCIHLCDFALPCIRASEGLTWHGVIPTDEIWLKSVATKKEDVLTIKRGRRQLVSPPRGSD